MTVEQIPAAIDALEAAIITHEAAESRALDHGSSTDLDVCGATIRNDLQVLAKQGFIEQPHTSAGRVPTKKAYKYLSEKIAEQKENEFASFIVRQIRSAHQQIEQEMRLTQELMSSLTETSMTLSISNMPEGEDLFEILNILGSSKTSFGKDMNIINEIIRITTGVFGCLLRITLLVAHGR